MIMSFQRKRRRCPNVTKILFAIRAQCDVLLLLLYIIVLKLIHAWYSSPTIFFCERSVMNWTSCCFAFEGKTINLSIETNLIHANFWHLYSFPKKLWIMNVNMILSLLLWNRIINTLSSLWYYHLTCSLT